MGQFDICVLDNVYYLTALVGYYVQDIIAVVNLPPVLIIIPLLPKYWNLWATLVDWHRLRLVSGPWFEPRWRRIFSWFVLEHGT